MSELLHPDPSYSVCASLHPCLVLRTRSLHPPALVLGQPGGANSGPTIDTLSGTFLRFDGFQLIQGGLQEPWFQRRSSRIWIPRARLLETGLNRSQ